MHLCVDYIQYLQCHQEGMMCCQFHVTIVDLNLMVGLLGKKCSFLVAVKRNYKYHRLMLLTDTDLVLEQKEKVTARQNTVCRTLPD